MAPSETVLRRRTCASVAAKGGMSSARTGPGLNSRVAARPEAARAAAACCIRCCFWAAAVVRLVLFCFRGQRPAAAGKHWCKAFDLAAEFGQVPLAARKHPNAGEAILAAGTAPTCCRACQKQRNKLSLHTNSRLEADQKAGLVVVLGLGAKDSFQQPVCATNYIRTLNIHNESAESWPGLPI